MDARARPRRRYDAVGGHHLGSPRWPTTAMTGRSVRPARTASTTARVPANVLRRAVAGSDHGGDRVRRRANEPTNCWLGCGRTSRGSGCASCGSRLGAQDRDDETRAPTLGGTMLRLTHPWPSVAAALALLGCAALCQPQAHAATEELLAAAAACAQIDWRDQAGAERARTYRCAVACLKALYVRAAAARTRCRNRCRESFAATVAGVGDRTGWPECVCPRPSARRQRGRRPPSPAG